MLDPRFHILPPSYENESDYDPLAVIKGVLAGLAISAMGVGLVMLCALEVRAWLYPWG